MPSFVSQYPDSRRETYRTSAGSSNLLSGVALNATASARTIDVQLGQGAIGVSISWQLARSAATDVQVTPSVSLDGGSTFVQLHSRTISAGVGTMTAYLDSKTVSGNSSGVSYFDVPPGATDFRAVFSGTSAGANDLITVQCAVRRDGR